MGIAEQLVLCGFLALGATLWLDAARAMRSTQTALTRSAQRLDYAEAALKEIHRETHFLRRMQEKKAGFKQCEARLSEAATFFLSKKNGFETPNEFNKEVALA